MSEFTWSLGTLGSTWADLEQAIRAWVLTATGTVGLPEAAVYFADQPMPADPNAPRVTISIDGPYQVGVDGKTWEFDGAAAAGQEIALRTEGNREIVVRLQAFAPTIVGPGVTARVLMVACQGFLHTDAVREALWAAGVGVLEVGDVVRVPQVVSGRQEDRATLDSRFTLRQEVTERTGYFSTVTIEGTIAPQ